MIDQVEIHRLVQSEDVEERRWVVVELKINFASLNDEKQAWDDLHRLTQDNDEYVRRHAADALGACYSHVPEGYKKQAWDDLHRLTQDNDEYVRKGAANSLGACYSHIPEEYKKQAWDDLIKLTQDKDDSCLLYTSPSPRD